MLRGVKMERFIIKACTVSDPNIQADIFIDEQTGVNYIVYKNGYNKIASITPRYQADGKLVVSSQDEIKEIEITTEDEKKKNGPRYI